MENNIYNAPESALVTEGEDHSELASRWSRLGASLIDALTIAPVTLALMYFTGGFSGITEGVQPSLTYTLAMAAIGIVIFLLVHGYFLLADGQTLGKKALSIKIVTIDNQHAQITTLAKRYGFYWIVPQIPVVGPFINMVNILFIFTKSKRCLHDHVGGTKVVKIS